MSPAAGTRAKLQASRLSAYYGSRQVLRGVSLAVPEHAVTVLLGPSGCGKSTLLRSFNRLNELVPGFRWRGKVTLDGQDIYAPAVDVNGLRRRVGMIFQRPNPFPFSVYDNVAYGPRRHGVPEEPLRAMVRDCLERAGLWAEVRDRLGRSALELSGGQQQRLCIARALAVDPEVLLMDEPTAALDRVAAAQVERLVGELARERTVLMVTHNLDQARHAAHFVAMLRDGELVVWGEAAKALEQIGRDKNLTDS